MTKTRRKIAESLIVAIACATALCCGDNLKASARISGLTSSVSVQYDAQAIPHIRCATQRDCVAVQGYVQARDRMFAMDVLRHTARARLAELVGPSAVPQDVQIRTLFVTRSGHRVEVDLAASLDEPTRTLLVAFAAGVNAYLAELRARPGDLPTSGYATLPTPVPPSQVADWTIEDTLAIGRLSQFQLSESLTEEIGFSQLAAVFGPGGAHEDLGKLAAWVRSAAPATERAHTMSPDAATPTTRAAPARVMSSLAPWASAIAQLAETSRGLRDRIRLPAEVGSNNWAISGRLSVTGDAMLANDPHLTLQSPPLFHLVAMTSAKASEHVDIAGASFPGIPGILLGRGQHVAWGVTVTGYDVTDLYLEQFLPQASCPSSAPCVLFRGRPTSTIVVPQVFLARTGAGLVDARTLGLPSSPPSAVIIVPHHGPVVRAPDSGGRALSVRWTGQEGTTQDTRALFSLGSAANVDAAVVDLRDFAVGAQNFAMADDSGRIAYNAHALVPVRRFAEGRGALPPWLPLPGDGSAEWGDGVSDCAASGLTPLPSSCWVADDLLPHLVDPAKGYLFTANADPTFPSVSDDNDPLAHPPYLSFAWDDSSGFRATRIQDRIERAIAGGRKLSLSDMESMQADHASRVGMAFAPHVARAVSAPVEVSSADLDLGRAILGRWASAGAICPSGLTGTDPASSSVDPRGSAIEDASGCLLFHEFLRALYDRVFRDDLALAGQVVNSISATKAMLLMLGLPDHDLGASFCDDVDGKGVVVARRSCADQVAIALATATAGAIARLGPDPRAWIWGRAHVAHLSSPVATSPIAQISPLARPGGLFTVDVGNPSMSGTAVAGDFTFTAGSNVRHISVMSARRPIVRMQIPGSERDGSGSAAGPDLLDQWARNVYFDLPFGDQVDRATTSTQIIDPAP